jgi:ParB family chromosome partitioning protein
MSDTPTPKKTNKKLGRGLSALLGEDEDDEQTGQLERLRQTRNLPIERMAPGPFQPRRHFDEEELAELSESIREQGLLQPILVRRDPEGEDYQIIAGERRWRAAQLAQLHEVPVLVREFDDRTAMEIALVENIQRKDLGPLEEAEGYRRLSDEYGHQQEAISRAVGKSRSHVANMMRLLSLPDDVRSLLDDGQLTMGHARALLSAEDASSMAREIVTRKLNVRDVERLIQKEKAAQDAGEGNKRPGGGAGAGGGKDADTRVLEEDLAERLGLAVSINHNARSGAGQVVIRYKDLDQLDLVVERLSAQPVEPGTLDTSKIIEYGDEYDRDFTGARSEHFDENMQAIKAAAQAAGKPPESDAEDDPEADAEADIGSGSGAAEPPAEPPADADEDDWGDIDDEADDDDPLTPKA